MEKQPLISVAMGIYNCADTLEEAVKCIIDQTYPNWELIMCDDCSKDNTYEVAIRLAEKDDRIIVLKNDTNMTLASTLNKCVKYAKGKYIARMDGDDICDPTRFEKEVAFLETHSDYALVSVWMDMYDEEGVFRTIHYKEEPQKEHFLTGSQFCHAGCMMKKEVFDFVNGYSESMDYKRVEDYDLWVRMYANGYKGYNIQESLYSMRDDRNAEIRRSFSNRKNEARVSRNVVKLFNLSKIKYLISLAPIVKYFIPTFLARMIHRKQR